MALHAACDPVDHPTHVTPRETAAHLFGVTHVDPARDTIIGFNDVGDAVAFGAMTLHPSRETDVYGFFGGRVHPDLRRRGVGAEVFRWEHERGLQALAETDSDLPAALFFTADENSAGARALADSRGLRIERYFTTMVRDLATPVTGPEIDETELRILPYDPSWKEAVRLARNDAFRDHWGSLSTPPESWDLFVGSEHFRNDHSWIAVAGDEVAAFSLSTVDEDDWEQQGYSSVYIEYVGVRRAWRGKKLAPAVIATLLRNAREAGLERAVLDVDTENPSGAHNLYGSLDFVAGDVEASFVIRY